MPALELSPGLGSRKRKQLAPLQTDLISSPAPAVASPVDVNAPETRAVGTRDGQSEGSVVNGAALRPKSKRSRNNLLNLFARDKPAEEDEPKTSSAPERHHEPPPEPCTPAEAAPPMLFKRSTWNSSPDSPTTVASQASTVIKKSKPEKAVFAQGEKSAKKAAKVKEPANAQSTWTPPPLYQAYPQAIRHAKLKSPDCSAETVLRLAANLRKTNATRSRARSSHGRGPTSNDSGEPGAGQEPGDCGINVQWIDKVYMLCTSGNLVQYAGDGPHDRAPQRIMQLCKDSAAFACDEMPGKPFVLRVERASDGQLPSQRRSRGIFSKLSWFGGPRRSEATFLLFLESADALDEWVLAVRKAVEALGGQPCQADECYLRNSTSDNHRTIQERPSQRSLPRRDPLQVNHSGLCRSSSDSNVKPQARAPPSSLPPVPALPGFSIRNINASNSAVSTVSDSYSSDQLALDRLKESPASTAETPLTDTAEPTPMITPLNISDQKESRDSASSTDKRSSLKPLSLPTFEQLEFPGFRSSLSSRPISYDSNSGRSPIQTTLSGVNFSRRLSREATPPASVHSESRRLSTARRASLDVAPTRPDSTVADVRSAIKPASRPTGQRTSFHASFVNLPEHVQTTNSANPPLSLSLPTTGPSTPFSCDDRSNAAALSPTLAKFANLPPPHPPPTTALPPPPIGGSRLSKQILRPPRNSSLMATPPDFTAISSSPETTIVTTTVYTGKSPALRRPSSMQIQPGPPPDKPQPKPRRSPSAQAFRPGTSTSNKSRTDEPISFSNSRVSFLGLPGPPPTSPLPQMPAKADAEFRKSFDNTVGIRTSAQLPVGVN